MPDRRPRGEYGCDGWVVWQGRKRLIREVVHVWSERDGELMYRCFSVSDGSQVYELRFNPRELCWRLATIALDG